MIIIIIIIIIIMSSNKWWSTIVVAKLLSDLIIFSIFSSFQYFYIPLGFHKAIRVEIFNVFFSWYKD